MVRRAGLLAVAAVVLAGVADAQYVRPARMDETGWLAMGAPAGATTGCVGVFLGSPLNLQCAAGLAYTEATGTLGIGGGSLTYDATRENVAFGGSTLAALTYVAGSCATGGASGFSMLAMGVGAASRQTVACESTFVGYHAGQGPIGGGANWWNTGYGRASLGAVRNGSLNSCGGEASCAALRDGNQNAGWGADVLGHVTDGSYNTAFGAAAARSMVTSSRVTAIGNGAGMWRLEDRGIYLGFSAGQYPYVGVNTGKYPVIIDSSSTAWPFIVGNQVDNRLRVRGDVTAVAPGTPGAEVLPSTTFDGSWTRTGAFSIAGGAAAINSTSNGTVYATVTGKASTWYQLTVTVGGATYPPTTADIPYCKLSVTTGFADEATYIPSTNGTYTIAVRSTSPAPTRLTLNADPQGATACALSLTSPSLKEVTGGVVNAVGGFAVNAASGITKTVTVRDSGGAADCTQTFTGGILTACTCTGCAP